MSREPRNNHPLSGKMPPSNVAVEAEVLGACLMSREAIDEVADVLRSEDFFRAWHGEVWSAIKGLWSKGEPVTIASVAEALKGEDKAADFTSLAEITANTPHSADARYNAEIVRQKAVGRELIRWSNEVLAAAYAQQDTSNAQVQDALSGLLKIADRGATSRVYDAPAFMEIAWNGLQERRLGKATGLKIGFPQLDELIGGFANQQLIIVAARPAMGKTAFAMRIAEAFAVDQGLPTLMFSMEMGVEELADRLWSGRSQVMADKLKNPMYLNDSDENRLGKAHRDLADSALHIDDTAARSVEQIAATARRHAGRGGLKAVIVDYLQLIEEDSDRSSRQEEVARITRSLKALAKELNLPVVALSQLNRKSEDRPDKRPKLSDLRECVTADTTIYCSRTGRIRTVGEYVSSGVGPSVYGLDDRASSGPWKVGTSKAEPFWSTGIKPVFRVRTATGRQIRCTANHPLRTIGGWKPLEEIRVGQRIASPRFLPEPSSAADPMHRDEARLLGYLISDGTYLPQRSVGYVKADPAMVSEVERIARDRFGIEAKDHACRGPARQIELTRRDCGPGGNPVIEWLKSLGIHGQKGHRKTIPDALLSSSNEIVAEFMATLWAGDGCVTRRKHGGYALKFSSTSMRLLEQMQMLLLRFRIVSVLGKPGRNTKSTRDIALLSISDSRQVIRFSEHFALPGRKGEQLEYAADECRMMDENSHIDRMPIEATAMISSAKREAGLSWSGLGYRCQGKEIHPGRFAELADRLGHRGMQSVGAADVLWDKVVSIEPDGEAETFDVRVPGIHNFVAGGIFAHNSGAIEQDADKVILLHRPEYYDPTDMPGTAEVIVAKNRSGQTGTVRLRWDKETTRFSVDPDEQF